MDWFDLLVVQGTLKSLLQHHSSKALILWCSAFFIVSLTLTSTMTTGKTIPLTRWTFVVLPPPSIILLNKYFKLCVSIISLIQKENIAMGLFGTVLYLKDMYLFS